MMMEELVFVTAYSTKLDMTGLTYHSAVASRNSQMNFSLVYYGGRLEPDMFKFACSRDSVYVVVRIN